MPFLSLIKMKKTLKKADRLYKRDSIQRLFQYGKSISTYPIRLLYSYEDHEKGESFLKASWVVPKKNFTKAVDRNALKRKMREAYRIHKGTLQESLQEGGKCLHLIFIYNSKEKISYKAIEGKIILILLRLQDVK